MFEQLLPGDPICLACAHRIQAGDRVYVGHGWLVHLGCRVTIGSRSSSEAVARLLSSDPAARLCHACVARSLDLSIHEVKQAISRLTLAPTFHVGVSRCSNCERRSQTVCAEPSPSMVSSLEALCS